MAKRRLTVTVPDYYSEATKQFMKQVVKALNDNGELTTMTFGVVGMLRDCYETYQKATRSIMEDDEVILQTLKGDKVSHPAVKLQLQANQQVLALMKELGLTTRSRKVIDKVGGGEADQLSLFDELG